MSDADLVELTASALLDAARDAGMLLTGDMRVGECDAAALIGLEPESLAKRRKVGDAPRAYRVPVGAARISYRLRDIAEWVEARAYTDE